MGLGILVNTLLVLWLAKLLWRAPSELPRPYLWGIRLGLAIFLLGSAVGAEMIARQAHTVGATDGGPARRIRWPGSSPGGACRDENAARACDSRAIAGGPAAA